MPYMPIMFSMFFMVDLLGCRGFFRPCRPFAVAIKICSSSSQRVYQRCNQSGGSGSGSTWKQYFVMVTEAEAVKTKSMVAEAEAETIKTISMEAEAEAEAVEPKSMEAEA